MHSDVIGADTACALLDAADYVCCALSIYIKARLYCSNQGHYFFPPKAKKRIGCNRNKVDYKIESDSERVG